MMEVSVWESKADFALKPEILKDNYRNRYKEFLIDKQYRNLSYLFPFSQFHDIEAKHQHCNSAAKIPTELLQYVLASARKVGIDTSDWERIP